MPDFLAVFEWGAKSLRDALRGVGAATCAVINSPFEAEAARRAAAYAAWEEEWEVLPGTDEEEALAALRDDPAEFLRSTHKRPPFESLCHCSSLGGECIWCADANEAQERLDRNPQTKAKLAAALADIDNAVSMLICDQCGKPTSITANGLCNSCYATPPMSPAQPVAASGAVEGPRRGCPPSPSGVPTNFDECLYLEGALSDIAANHRPYGLTPLRCLCGSDFSDVIAWAEHVAEIQARAVNGLLQDARRAQ